MQQPAMTVIDNDYNSKLSVVTVGSVVLLIFALLFYYSSPSAGRIAVFFAVCIIATAYLLVMHQYKKVFFAVKIEPQPVQFVASTTKPKSAKGPTPSPKISEPKKSEPKKSEQIQIEMPKPNTPASPVWVLKTQPETMQDVIGNQQARVSEIFKEFSGTTNLTIDIIRKSPNSTKISKDIEEADRIFNAELEALYKTTPHRSLNAEEAKTMSDQLQSETYIVLSEKRTPTGTSNDHAVSAMYDPACNIGSATATDLVAFRLGSTITNAEARDYVFSRELRRKYRTAILYNQPVWPRPNTSVDNEIKKSKSLRRNVKNYEKVYSTKNSLYVWPNITPRCKFSTD